MGWGIDSRGISLKTTAVPCRNRICHEKSFRGSLHATGSLQWHGICSLNRRRHFTGVCENKEGHDWYA
jgi:hypothetical protein